MPKKTAIVIHHTASHWCDAAEVNRWHKLNGWSGIGYHFLINNGFPAYKDYASGRRRAAWNGKVEKGREETALGAHVREGNMNRHAIGVALVGHFDVSSPTPEQMESVVNLCAELCRRHSIPVERIYYHRDWAVNPQTQKPYKSCPGKNFPSRTAFRALVAARLREEAPSLSPAVPAGSPPPAAPKLVPKLVLNGATVEQARLVDGAWCAPVSAVAHALGEKSNESALRPLREALDALGWDVIATNNRLKERARYDVRARRRAKAGLS